MFYVRMLVLILLGSVAINSARADTIASLTFFFGGPNITNQAPTFIYATGEATFTFNYSLLEKASPGSYVSIRLPDLLTFGLTGTAGLSTAGSVPTPSTNFSIGLADLTAFDYTYHNIGIPSDFTDLSFTATPVASSNPNFGPALMDIDYITHEGGADITFPQNVYGLSTPGVIDAFSSGLVLTTQPAPPTSIPEPSAMGSILLSAVIFTCSHKARKLICSAHAE